MNVKDATGRLARWALLLQQYNFVIIHRPGCQYGNADASSKRLYPTTNLNALQQSESETDKIREKQRKDPELSEIMDYFQNDVLPSSDAKAAIVFTSVRMAVYCVISIVARNVLVIVFLNLLFLSR